LGAFQDPQGHLTGQAANHQQEDENGGQKEEIDGVFQREKAHLNRWVFRDSD